MINKSFSGTQPPDSIRSYLWGMIQLKPGYSLSHEIGYWKDLILHRREFHDPVKFAPAEVRYGLFFYGGGGADGDKVKNNWMKYDENVPGFDGGNVLKRTGHLLDIDFAKTNLFYYGLKASWLDMQTGINFKYSNLFVPGELPTGNWENTNPSWNPGKRLFAPRTLSLGISHNIIMQWFELWFIDMRYTWGLATTKFYLDSGKNLLDSPSAWGPSMSISFGPRIILDPGKNNRFSVGVEMRYSYTKFENIDDPGDMTPIKSMHLQDFGLYVTFSIFYGGKLTVGDQAKTYYYRKDYVTAKGHFETFLADYPDHVNRQKAEEFLAQCRKKIPLQLFEEGLQFEKRKLTSKAIERYMDALAKGDNETRPVIEAQLNHLATLEIEKAELLASQGRAEEALQLMKNIAHFSEKARLKIPYFEARYLFQEGEKAMKYGFYRKALENFDEALNKDNSLEVEIKTLRYQIATHLVETANKMTDSEEMRAALQMLKDASDLTGGLGQRNEQILEELKENFAADQEREATVRIDNRMELVRQAAKEKETTPPLSVGMTVPDIQSLLGNPRDIIEKKDKDGKSIQLWIYPLEEGGELLLSFKDYILFKIEKNTA